MRVRAQFAHLDTVWPNGDLWSARTRSEITERIRASKEVYLSSELVSEEWLLNLGSHGNDYGLRPFKHVHVDLVESSLKGISLAVVGDAEQLPFVAESFDTIICVGSVINYCSPPRLLAEASRVLKRGGHLLLEFETSESFEFIFTADMSKDVSLVKTFYNGVVDSIYVYSQRYITNALDVVGLRVKSIDRFHRLSTLIYRLSKHEHFAAWFARIDQYVGKLPFVKEYSANIFMTAQKI